jgi:hypothetical protein
VSVKTNTALVNHEALAEIQRSENRGQRSEVRPEINFVASGWIVRGFVDIF